LEPRRPTGRPVQGLVVTQPFANEREAAIAELRALFPEASGERKASEMSVNLNFDLRPTSVEMVIPVWNSNANPVRIFAVFPSAHIHCVGSFANRDKHFISVPDRKTVSRKCRPGL
jgi:hypothetical protein